MQMRKPFRWTFIWSAALLAAALLHSFFSGRVRGVPDFLCHWKGMDAETAIHQGLSDLEFYGP